MGEYLALGLYVCHDQESNITQSIGTTCMYICYIQCSWNVFLNRLCSHWLL